MSRSTCAAEHLGQGVGHHRQAGRHQPGRPSRRGQQQTDEAPVEEARQPLRGVEEVERRARGRGVDHDQVVASVGQRLPVQLTQLLHRHVLLGAGERARQRDVERVLEDLLRLLRAGLRLDHLVEGALHVEHHRVERPARVGVDGRTPGAGCCRAARSPSTGRGGGPGRSSARRPCGPARPPAARARPTSSSCRRRPQPQHTMISVVRSSSSASTSRIGIGVFFMPFPGVGAAGRARRAPPGRCRPRGAGARRSARPRPRRARAARPRGVGVRRGRGPRRRATATSSASTSTRARASSEVTAVGSTRVVAHLCEGARAEVLRSHQVDHDPADREAGGAELGDAVGGLLHGHLLEDGDQVHGRARRAQQLHHLVGLGLDRAHLRQPGQLGVDAEELADAAGGRRVEHHGVVRDLVLVPAARGVAGPPRRPCR